LHIVEVSAQHGAISRRKFGPTGHADHDHLIGEDRRLLRPVGQGVYAAKPDEQHAQCQEQQHPLPAPTYAGPVRLDRHGATNRMAPRRVPDAG
jgi:hypothetical protein